MIGANATIRREASEALVAYERTFCRAITTKGERHQDSHNFGAHAPFQRSDETPGIVGLSSDLAEPDLYTRHDIRFMHLWPVP